MRIFVRGLVRLPLRTPGWPGCWSADGERSFIETLRHLLFATDSWISRDPPLAALLTGQAGWQAAGPASVRLVN